MQPNLAGMYVHGFEVGGNNPALDIGYVDNPLTASSPNLSMPVDSQGVDRKRTAQVEMRERAIDRRQRRMIKNRESAARSRARKQEIHENFSSPITSPRYQLRRTSSAPL